MARRRAVSGEPRPRLRGHAVARPRLQRAHGGVLHGVLGERQVAGDPRQRGEHAPALVAHEADEGGAGLGFRHPPKSITGRTSTAPSHAPGICAATLIASSRSAHSSR